jgi:hypothetical protein
MLISSRKVRLNGKKFLLLSLLVFLSVFYLVSANFGFADDAKPKLEFVTTKCSCDINYSTAYVNDSLYWQGHTGTDGSWLTGVSPSNSTYNATYAGLVGNISYLNNYTNIFFLDEYHSGVIYSDGIGGFYFQVAEGTIELAADVVNLKGDLTFAALNGFDSNVLIKNDGNLSVRNVCYSNGSQCLGNDYTNIAMENETNTFIQPQLFNSNVNMSMITIPLVSTNAFNMTNATGGMLLRVDTTNQRFLFGNSLTTPQATAHVGFDVNGDSFMRLERKVATRYDGFGFYTGSTEDATLGMRGSGEGYSNDLTIRGGGYGVMFRINVTNGDYWFRGKGVLANNTLIKGNLTVTTNITAEGGYFTAGTKQGLTIGYLIHNSTDDDCWMNYTGGLLTSSTC